MGRHRRSVSGRMGRNITSSPEVGEWVCNQTGGGYYKERSNAIGLKNGKNVVAGVVYENWNGKSVIVHIAIKERLTAAFLAAIFDYPFNVCNVNKLIAPVSSNNAKALKLITNMGFTEEARLKDADTNGDIVLLTMARASCRFLGKRYGQKISYAATCA